MIRLTRKVPSTMIQLRISLWQTSQLAIVPSRVRYLCFLLNDTIPLTSLDIDEQSPDEDEERARLALRRTQEPPTPPHELKGQKGKKQLFEESDNNDDERGTTRQSTKGVAVSLSWITVSTKYITF